LCARTPPFRLPIALTLALATAAADGADSPADAGQPPEPQGRFALHWQATYVEQETSDFHAPYRGTNSLTPDQGAQTADATLYLGARLWTGAEAWINPEIDQGFGLDDTLGLAGFPSGEAYKVGKNQPYLRLQRLFVRQTIDLAGATEQVDGGANQFATVRGVNRLVFTLGKFSVTDVFDTNQYAHDPRGDFLNWAAIEAGTFDYAADAWGYSVGAAGEWYQGRWTLRGGFFDLSNVPNSPHLEPGFDEFELIAEVERRHQISGNPGRLVLTMWQNRGRMGLLDDAVAVAEATGQPVDIAAVRSYRSRLGASLGLEQQLTSNLGMFARAGGAAGNVEVYEFTDIDHAFSSGLALKGAHWRRPDDVVGMAAIFDGISAARQRYLNAGGLGLLIGDGKLPHPGTERILETYYNFATLEQHLHLTFDYQWVVNPAYNEDRGPVSIFSFRFHVQF
jgi:high affinity Mn2+ porin